MSGVQRVSAQEIYAGVQSGDILLVCAYDSDKKFEKNHLAGSISLSEFKARLTGLAKDSQLVFFCA